MTIKRKEYVCAGCGQPIQPLVDSYNLVDGKPRHTTCPTSPALRDLPTVTTATIEGHGLAAYPIDGMGMIAPRSPRYYTLPEAAELLRAGQSTLRRYIREGKLPAKRLRAEGGSKSGSSRVLIEQGDLLALLEDAREAA